MPVERLPVRQLPVEIIDREDLQVDGRAGFGDRGRTGVGREQDIENKDENNKEAEA